MYVLGIVRASIVLLLIVAPLVNPAYHKTREAFRNYGE